MPHKHSWTSYAFAVLAALLVTALAYDGREAAAQDMGKPTRKSVKWLAPEDGAKVKSPVMLKFEAIGMETVPAGEPKDGTGHHHVIVDGPAPEEGAIIPADKTHLHFGKAQTEATVELKPGKHTLTLQFADGLHRSYGAGMSRSIEIEVVP